MKTTQRLFYALLTMAGMPLVISAESNAKTAVANCGAETIKCEAVVNAIGDQVEIDVSKYSVIDLGTITTEKTVDILLPKSVGMQTVYSLTPTTGESKGAKIFIVFDNLKQRPGTRLFGKTLVKIYRRFATEPKTSWIEVGSIVVNQKELPKPTTQVTLKPDGTATWIDPVTKEPTVFLVSKKNLT